MTSPKKSPAWSLRYLFPTRNGGIILSLKWWPRGVIWGIQVKEGKWAQETSRKYPIIKSNWIGAILLPTNHEFCESLARLLKIVSVFRTASVQGVARLKMGFESIFNGARPNFFLKLFVSAMERERSDFFDKTLLFVVVIASSSFPSFSFPKRRLILSLKSLQEEAFRRRRRWLIFVGKNWSKTKNTSLTYE